MRPVTYASKYNVAVLGITKMKGASSPAPMTFVDEAALELEEVSVALDRDRVDAEEGPGPPRARTARTEHGGRAGTRGASGTAGVRGAASARVWRSWH